MKKSQVILITGASSGMGKHAALTLIEEGHIVYGAARRIDQMKDIQHGGTVMAMDITNEADIIKVVNEIVTQHGRIDVLVNNAGYGLYGAVEDVKIDDARRQFEVNLFGLARITQEVLPYMREKKSGKIINMSSMGGKMYTPLGAWYHATKHALEGWSDCLRIELKPFDIDVVIIEPGAIDTEFGDVLYKPLLENSGDGAYSDMAKTMAKLTKESYEKEGNASPPSVITNLILKAINSQSPKTRYRAGKLAKPMVWLRTYLGDKIFDSALMFQLKKGAV